MTAPRDAIEDVIDAGADLRRELRRRRPVPPDIELRVGAILMGRPPNIPEEETA